MISLLALPYKQPFDRQNNAEFQVYSHVTTCGSTHTAETLTCSDMFDSRIPKQRKVGPTTITTPTNIGVRQFSA